MTKEFNTVEEDQREIDEKNRENGNDQPIDVPRLADRVVRKYPEQTVEQDTTEHGVVSPANEVFEYETENDGGPNQP